MSKKTHDLTNLKSKFSENQITIKEHNDDKEKSNHLTKLLYNHNQNFKHKKLLL